MAILHKAENPVKKPLDYRMIKKEMGLQQKYNYTSSAIRYFFKR